MVKRFLQEKFIPALFHRAYSTIPGLTITYLPVKHDVIDILEPTKTSQVN